MTEAQALRLTGMAPITPGTFSICNDHRVLVTIDLDTGKVTLHEGCDVDEPARLFWGSVERHYPADRLRP